MEVWLVRFHRLGFRKQEFRNSKELWKCSPCATSFDPKANKLKVPLGIVYLRIHSASTRSLLISYVVFHFSGSCEANDMSTESLCSPANLLVALWSPWNLCTTESVVQSLHLAPRAWESLLQALIWIFSDICRHLQLGLLSKSTVFELLLQVQEAAISPDNAPIKLKSETTLFNLWTKIRRKLSAKI